MRRFFRAQHLCRMRIERDHYRCSARCFAACCADVRDHGLVPKMNSIEHSDREKERAL